MQTRKQKAHPELRHLGELAIAHVLAQLHGKARRQLGLFPHKLGGVKAHARFDEQQ